MVQDRSVQAQGCMIPDHTRSREKPGYLQETGSKPQTHRLNRIKNRGLGETKRVFVRSTVG